MNRDGRETEPTAQAKARRATWVGRLEQGALAGVALASLTIGVLDLLGLLGSTVLAGRTAGMTLVLLGMVAAYLVLERRGLLTSVNESVDAVKASLSDLLESMGEVKSQAARLRVFFEGLGGDRFSELKLIYGLRSYSAAVAANEIRGGADQVFDLWADSLREATSFSAFNYVSPKEVWGTKGWAFSVAHAVQLERIRLGCTIKRVFILDDAAEYEEVKGLMLAQAEAGIMVRWIMKKELSGVPLIGEYTDAIGTWDFVVIDHDLLFRVAIDVDRRMKACSLLKARDLHQKGMYVFREALQRGHLPDDPPSSVAILCT